MAANKIIFVSQEISPYLTHTLNGAWGKSLPQSIQSRKYEVRVFMPDYGDINERRNQLHEVIRLSGINISIGDTDHPLVVKVASMQPSRIQVYFIDNDDYFQKSSEDVDPFGSNRADNDERIIFFARGTMETARKLRWEPEVMQVSGWVSTLVPLYLKRLFADGPAFVDTKLVYTILPEEPIEALDRAFFKKLAEEGVAPEDIAPFEAEEEFTVKTLHRMAIKYADAVVFQTPEVDEELKAYCDAMGKQTLHLVGEGDFADQYNDLYHSLMGK